MFDVNDQFSHEKFLEMGRQALTRAEMQSYPRSCHGARLHMRESDCAGIKTSTGRRFIHGKQCKVVPVALAMMALSAYASQVQWERLTITGVFLLGAAPY